MKQIYFWAMSSHGPGISGGDRIYIEFAKRWSESLSSTVVTWSEGVAMMARNGLKENKNILLDQVSIPEVANWFFLGSYIYRIVASLIKACTLEIKNPESTYIYSASEFWMDSLACWVLKLRYPNLKWVATWFQTAPSPWTGFASGQRQNTYRFNALLLWLSQLPIRPLISKFADFVLVNNDLEKGVFPKLNEQGKVVVVLGAVDLKPISAWRSTHPKSVKNYAAVFQGRFHPQKGVEELIDIWKMVVDKEPKARLAMIGDGPLMPSVKRKIEKLKLTDNVKLFGFVFDGSQKFEIFASSQMVLHPAFFDSGGMASAEAMAFGLPIIGFDLPSFESYYPKSMVKVGQGNLTAFSDAILELLKHSRKRRELGELAEEFVYKHYSWDFRAKQVLEAIEG